MKKQKAHGHARRAMPREAGAREDLLLRLRRVEGQVRGVQKMVEEDRYCIDVLTQVGAVKAALDEVALQLREVSLGSEFFLQHRSLLGKPALATP